MGLGLGFRTQHELIIHMTAGGPEYYDKGTSNVIASKRVAGDEREHQTQKPIELLARLISVVCPPAGIVLDSFVGSGSTLIAARSVGRHSIGIEREESNCMTAVARLRQSVLPFTPKQSHSLTVQDGLFGETA
jgi:site-specific DNA-methyltransferase (adenine-specific)